MQFYIFLDNVYTPVDVEVSPQLVKAKDTTNDSFSCVLKVNTQQEPIKPMTPFKVVYDDEKTQIFWIINDSVTVFSLNPESYKHSLTLVQYRYFLNKHLVRNTVFNQPTYTNGLIYTSVSNGTQKTTEGYISSSPGYLWYDPFLGDGHAKVKGIFLTVKMYGLVCYGDGEEFQYEEVPNYQTLESRNITLKENVEFRLFDETLGSFIGFNFNPFYYTLNKRTQIENITALKNYVLAHPNSSIVAKLFVDNNDVDGVHGSTYSFFDPTDSSIGYENTDDIVVYCHLTLQVSIEIESYNYNFYDVIQTLLTQYRLTSDNFGSKRELLFNLPTANSTGEDLELYNLLTTTYPPDTLAFTQATYYEALSEIFRFFDAGFKFDENKIIKIDYYNDLKNKKEEVK